MLRLILPPNLPAAATRDAIPVRIELTLTSAPPVELLPALAVLQRLCGTPKPPPFVQLTRGQLQELVTAAKGRPVFFFADNPRTALLWIGSHLREVSDHLRGAPPPAAPPAATPAAAPSVPRSPAPVSSPQSRPIEVPRSRGVPVTGSSIRPRFQATGTVRPRPAEDNAPLQVDGSENFLSVQLPSREHSTYAAALEWVKGNGFLLEPSNRRWWLRDRHKVLNLLASDRGRLEREFRASFSDNFERNTAHLSFAGIECAAEETSDGFAVTLGLSAGKVSEEKLLQAAAAGRGYLEDGKQIYLLAPDKLAVLAKAQRALAGHPGAPVVPRRTHRVSYARLSEAEDVLAEAAPGFQPPERWRARSEALRNLSKLAPAPLPADFEARLRPYQRLGAAWLWHLTQNGLGGILADEMGLGKTIQAIGLLLATHAPGTKRPLPSLVVCPASLVENWLRELARFAPALRAQRHHGNTRWDANSSCDVVVTSYGMLARERETFADSDFRCLICDEAQHAKNRRTLNAQSLRSLHAEARVMLTGTPVENSIEDLRSLFDILMPGLVDPLPPGTRGDDKAWFDERMRAKTAPYLLRRTKQAVAPELPPKIEQVVYCEMSAAQARLYREVQESSERALIDLESSGASEGALRLATLTQLLRLRQVCCDPRLLPEGLAQGREADSAKLAVFRELIEEAIDDGHRVLVFSQFTSLLGLLRQELDREEIRHCYLDGSMAAPARQTQVDAFQSDDSIPLFLISLKAGGTGLNLTGADTVIHLDPWWNPAVEAQATDRAHRIGQTRTVTSYKLICSGSVEEKVLQLQETKRALLADVFEASDAATAKLSLSDLKALLAD
ncbi:DEAD/DEAH box helicase [Nibricoccus sp. IMCC34717]|uniref:DEAD/DEAH box helicase n=1 Tax=Nibricoccus sp. IMCC34717 TaxID=3034021 RepID=UPI00385002F3